MRKHRVINFSVVYVPPESGVRIVDRNLGKLFPAGQLSKRISLCCVIMMNIGLQKAKWRFM